MSDLKILVINQFYYPDQTALSQIITDLTIGLIERSYSIEIICSKHSQVDTTEKDLYIGPKIQICSIGGTNFGKSFNVGRIVDYISFYVFALIHALKARNVSIVMTTTAPPLIGLVGVIVKKLRRCKFVYNVQDLYPHTAIELGVLKNRLLIRFFEFILSIIIQHSDHIVAIGEDMAQRIKAIYPDAPITIIHNWSDGERIFPVPSNQNPFKEKNKLQDKFLVLYSGNFGLAHQFKCFLEAAKLLVSYHDIHFLFIGDGQNKEYINRTVRNWDLKNVSVQYYEPVSMLRYSLSSADIALISLVDGLEGCIVPSKIYSLMAAGQSILFAGNKNSDVASIINKANCGYCVSSNDGHEIVKHILEQYENRTLNVRLKRNARSYFDKHFDRKMAIERYHELFHKIINL